MSGYLVLIESNTSGTGRQFVQAAMAQGFCPVMLATEPGRYSYASNGGLQVIPTETDDLYAMRAVCRRLKREAGLAGITSSSEYYVASAATLAHEFHLPGPSARAVRACRDKWRQRLALHAAEVGCPEFHLARSVREAVVAARRIKGPVVLKPVMGTGSSGVRLCSAESEVKDHARYLLTQRFNDRGLSVPRRILVEALAVGPEFSVEMFGEQVVGITAKHVGDPPHFVEIGHDFPARVSDETARLLSDTARQAVRALQLGWGPAHVELRLTANGAVIMEVNPRAAGGFIPELVRLATGIDIIEDTIRLATGQAPRLLQICQRSASIRFLLPNVSGMLLAAVGLAAAQSRFGVTEARLYGLPGQVVTRRGDFRDRIGHVITTGASTTEAQEAAEAACAAVHLCISTALPF